ncbi:2,3-diaminopropionate biosynthesis protein SbnB [Methylosinus sporium]|uniref:2,3-diaminopropionate biosynthesis protein SbnB n=1 Tax=Methylosinus sporium TaxID=428 RepID=A0A549T3L5_METSR|nr:MULTISPECIES: 2,3-diaminopropionate biosynthesis protein SbnB [Methylosinus]MBU3890737.1 2,3-diaminopropionate biosynthesis protein SbnB [Methylosinus sp. KRF6]TRL36414.1 2,3-diaminopropionate biosynthesis protein SbnB [Methylosinus sporium]
MNTFDIVRHAPASAHALRFLSRADIASLGGNHSGLYMQAVEDGFRLHAAGDYAQPLKPYLRSPRSSHIADRIIAMPAWIGGDDPIAGIKWIGSKHDNPSARSMERASAVIVLNDANTHFPIAILEAGRISALRTAAVTGVACRHLAKQQFRRVAIIGCGPIGRTQIEMFCEQFPYVREIRLHDAHAVNLSEGVQWAQTAFPEVEFVRFERPRAAIEGADVVVTCTVTDRPYLPFEWLSPGAFLANVSIMDAERDVFLRADKVVVDDWDQSNREKKIINQLVEAGSFSRQQLYAELGEIVVGSKPGRENGEEIILLNPMGMAIDDIVCARAILRRAEAGDVGTMLDLF